MVLIDGFACHSHHTVNAQLWLWRGRPFELWGCEFSHYCVVVCGDGMVYVCCFFLSPPVPRAIHSLCAKKKSEFRLSCKHTHTRCVHAHRRATHNAGIFSPHLPSRIPLGMVPPGSPPVLQSAQHRCGCFIKALHVFVPPDKLVPEVG